MISTIVNSQLPLLIGEEDNGELITNGDMSSDTGWTLFAGSTSTIEITGGKLEVDDTPEDGFPTASQDVPTLAVNTYRIAIDVDSLNVGGGVIIGIAGSFSAEITAEGPYTEDVVGVEDQPNIIISFTPGTIATLDNFSVTQL